MTGEREAAGPHSHTEARKPGTQQDDTQLCCEIQTGLPLGQQTVPGGSRGLWGSGTFSPVLGMVPPYGNCQPAEQQQKDACSNAQLVTVTVVFARGQAEAGRAPRQQDCLY